MKKKIILFLLLTSALFIGLNEAKATIAGTCVCYSPSTLQTMEKDCNTWQTDNKMSDNDVLNYNNVETGENACDKICTSTGVYQWAASTGMIGKKETMCLKMLLETNGKMNGLKVAIRLKVILMLLQTIVKQHIPRLIAKSSQIQCGIQIKSVVI